MAIMINKKTLVTVSVTNVYYGRIFAYILKRALNINYFLCINTIYMFIYKFVHKYNTAISRLLIHTL